MKTIYTLFLFCLCFSPLLVVTHSVRAEKKPPVVVNVAPAQAAKPTSAFTANTTSLAVIQQKLEDLSQAESRRDLAESTLETTLQADLAALREKEASDDIRLDKLDAEATTICTVGGVGLTILLAFLGWIASVASERHKENRETNQSISVALQHLSTSVAVMESKLTGEHK